MNQRLVAQYDGIEVLPDLFVNGQLTVTENVTNLEGVETAYDALQNLLAEEVDMANSAVTTAPATPVTTSDLLGFTSEWLCPGGAPPQREKRSFSKQQRLFIRAAPVWRGEIRDEALVTRVRSGVHAPPEVRATQPLHTTDEFYNAFGIVEGDPMYLAPAERIRIW